MFKEIFSYNNILKTDFPIIQSVLDKTQDGRVFEWKDNYFIIHKSGFSLFVNASNCYSELINLFLSQKLPQYFHIYEASDELMNLIEPIPEFTLRKRRRFKYEVFDSCLSVASPLLPHNFSQKTISKASLKDLSIFKLDLESRFWNSEEDLLKSSMGIFIENENEIPVSICYAASVGNGRAEIDVITMENYRGMGLAKASVYAFIKNCHNQNLMPNWDCFDNNFGSIKTAESLEFKKNREYNFLSIYKNNK